VIDVVRRDGFQAGRAVADVEPGENTEVPPIELVGSGQIAGIVSKRGESGLEPLANVEVVARGDMVVIMADGTATLAPEGETGDVPLIYPPPPAQTYSAFTDESGSYVMKGVQAGMYLVSVAVPGFVPGQAFVSVEPGHTTAVDFILVPAIEPGVGTVKGTVTGETSADDSTPKPLEGAVVTVVMNGEGWEPPEPGEPEPMPVIGSRAVAAQADAGTSIVPPDTIWRRFRTLTDQSGQYSLNVPSGYGRIAVWCEGYVPVREGLTIKPLETVVKDFLLEALEITPVEPPNPEPEPGPVEPGPPEPPAIE